MFNNQLDDLRRGAGFPPMYGPDACPRLTPEEVEEYKPILCTHAWAFILRMTRALQLGRVCTHTALVFFHRFFKHQDIFRHDRLLMAATCVYLATKTEEKEKSCKLTAITVQYMIQSGHALSPECDERDPKWYMDLEQRALARKNADPKAVELWARVQAPILEWRNRVIVYERGLLYTIKFDLNVAHPFKALGDGMKVVRDMIAPHHTSFDHRLFFSHACKFMNDSMSQPLIVDAEPSYLAAMALYLTTLLHDVTPRQDTWPKLFNVQDEERFYADCSQILTLYDAKTLRRLHCDHPSAAGGGGGGGRHFF